MTWTLHHDDCLAGMAGLADKSVDCVITDPPYAISQKGVVHKGLPGKGSRRLDFFEGDSDHAAMTDFVIRVATETLRVMSPTASAYWYCGHRQFGRLVALFEGAGFTTRFLVWAKACPAPPPPGAGWPAGAELCVYAYRRGARTWTHDGTNTPPNNVITVDSFRHGQPGKFDHPTQKPLAVIEPLLLASSRPGELILDPFAGSGTTGVACIRNGRRFVGFEKDEKYHALATKRLSETREQGGLFEPRVKHKQAVLL